MPSLSNGPTQVTKTENVGSVDVFSAAHLFTFGPRGKCNALKWSLMVSKKSAKIGGTNGMPDPPTVQTQVTLREMCVLWTLLGRPIYSHLALGSSVMH